MKKILLFLILFLVCTSTAFAQTKEPTASESNPIQKKIDDLKERLATRVAELKSQNKKSLYGVIKQKDDGKIILSNSGIDLPVTYDKDTKISVRTLSGKKSDTDDKMLTVGSNVVAFGTLDIDQKTLLSKYLLIHDQPIVSVGTVESVDLKDGSFTITSTDGKMTLEYEINTKCRMYDGDALVSCGLSKINKTDRVIVRMLPIENQSTKSSALRIVLLPTRAAPNVLSPTTKVSPALKPTSAQ
jgi:hypothetical protein